MQRGRREVRLLVNPCRRVENFVPELLSAIGWSVNFETIFTGVAGARNDCVNSINATTSEVVILDFGEWQVSQLLQDRLCVRPLQRELAVISADVLQLDRFAGVMRCDPLPVFFGRAGIDDEKQVVCGKTINHQVVDDRALWRCQG